VLIRPRFSLCCLYSTRRFDRTDAQSPPPRVLIRPRFSLCCLYSTRRFDRTDAHNHHHRAQVSILTARHAFGAVTARAAAPPTAPWPPPSAGASSARRAARLSAMPAARAGADDDTDLDGSQPPPPQSERSQLASLLELLSKRTQEVETLRADAAERFAAERKLRAQLRDARAGGEAASAEAERMRAVASFAALGGQLRAHGGYPGGAPTAHIAPVVPEVGPPSRRQHADYIARGPAALLAASPASARRPQPRATLTGGANEPPSPNAGGGSPTHASVAARARAAAAVRVQVARQSPLAAGGGSGTRGYATGGRSSYRY
jgi:hypothetical protein